MKMGHVTIRTDKFEEEIRFFQDLAGLHIVADMRDKGSDIVFLAEKDEYTRIEIIRQDDAVKSGNEYISIGFESSDLEKLREDFIARGIAGGSLISPAPPVKFFFVKDPAGVNIQFVTQKN